MTPYELILQALSKAQMSKTDIAKVTGVPMGPLGHALEVLIIEKKVEKVGLRYRKVVKR